MSGGSGDEGGDTVDVDVPFAESLTIESPHPAEPVIITGVQRDATGTRWVDWMCERCRTVYRAMVPQGTTSVVLPRRACNGRVEAR